MGVSEDSRAVISTDGTQISYWRSGQGNPLLLVHGTACDRSIWNLVQPGFAARFTVYTMNRRSREGSGALAEYELEREFEDVAAVVDSIGEPVHLLGHSAGALCALGGALLTERARSLTLYEPPASAPGMSRGAQLLRELIEDGKAEEATAAFLQAGPEQSVETVQRVKQSPVWPGMVAVASTIPYELEAISRYHFEAAHFGAIDVPVLLLMGGESLAPFRDRCEALAEVMPSAILGELPGQRHMANVLAPDLFLSEVLSFLETVEETP